MLGDRWFRCQEFWKDRPPTINCDSGRIATAVLDKGEPSGVFIVSLNYKYSEEGLRDDCECCEENWILYLHAMEMEFGEPIKLVSHKAPYLVDLVNKTCTCPDYQQRGISCKHLMSLYYGFCLMQYHIDMKTGRVTFKEYEEDE